MRNLILNNTVYKFMLDECLKERINIFNQIYSRNIVDINKRKND